jgi:phosphodiesterase/alkaline phosphatase D-like protein
MPSIIPSYIYTLFASIIVGTIVISACGLSTANVKYEVEKQQLSNIAEYVATESLELISHATAENLTATLHLNVPQLIGNQRYWIKVANDSSKTWVEAGFGTTAISSEQLAYIPSEVAASGTYTSGSGAAILECYSDSAGVHLNLSGGN